MVVAPVFCVQKHNNFDDDGLKSVLSCFEACNTSKLSQRGCFTDIFVLMWCATPYRRCRRCVLSSGKRLVFTPLLPITDFFVRFPYFSFQDKKGEKEDHFPLFQDYLLSLKTSSKLQLSALIKTWVFLRLISKTYVRHTFLTLSRLHLWQF